MYPKEVCTYCPECGSTQLNPKGFLGGTNCMVCGLIIAGEMLIPKLQ